MSEIKDIKSWNVEIENKITESWKKSEQFNVKSETKKKIYSIDTPPPYVNSPIHIAQAITYCYMDFFARYKRMKGFDVIFPLGLDRNGLPIELSAEKKFNISPFQVGRDKFIEYCEKLINEGSEGTTESFAKLGISFTSYKEGNHLGAVYKTDSPEYRKLTQSTFIDLYKKGLVYEDTRINNWDPRLQTTISDSEIEYKDLPSTFNHIKWKTETGEEITIATTRPELICSCGMIIYHPSDKRYKKLEGKYAISPLYNKKIPIKAHTLADPEKGSGIVMMCSAGDLSDIQFFREMKIKPIISINKDGTMNENSHFLKGLKVKEARKKILDILKEKNLLVKQENIIHNTPVSERSGAEIEFIEMPEFYLKQTDFLKDLKKIIKNINFYPKEAKKILDSWIDSVSIDWPISRRRFYATPIPLWHSNDLTAVPPANKYYIPWKETPSKESEVYQNGKPTHKKLKDFKNLSWIGETRVFDTWMDSSISELFILKYKENNNFFKKAYPSSLRPQGKEIVRTWLYYTILRGYLETKKACFNDVWIHQHLTDSKGKKMSKSLGNTIDSRDLMKKYGAEAIRFWASTEGNLAKQDLKVSEEKIQSELKTLNKIINISKFISLFEKPKTKPNRTALDQLLIDYIEDLTERTDKNYDVYDFYTPAIELRKFIWETFASHYLELIKNRAYNEDKNFTKEESESAKFTLHYLFERFLTLMYPIIPQLTSTLAKEKKIDLLKAEFPKAKKGKSNLKLIEELMDFNKTIWKTKKDKNISLREPLSNIKIPSPLIKFEKDLKACHKI